MTQQTPVSEEQVKNLILSGNIELKESIFAQLLDVSKSLATISTKQGDYFDFMKLNSSAVKDNADRIRTMEPLMASVAMIEKMSNSIADMNTKLSKLDDVPKKLDNLVSKEEFSRTISDMKADIDKIKNDNEKNSELRKNIAFLFAFLIVAVPIMMKGFDYISK